MIRPWSVTMVNHGHGQMMVDHGLTANILQGYSTGCEVMIFS